MTDSTTAMITSVTRSILSASQPKNGAQSNALPCTMPNSAPCILAACAGVAPSVMAALCTHSARNSATITRSARAANEAA